MDVDLDGDGFTETPVEFLAQLTSPAQPIFAEVLHHACYETLSHEYRMQLDCHFSPGVVANVQRSFDLQTWEFVPFSTTIGGSAAETAVIGNGGVFSLFMDAAEPRAFFRIFADLRNSPP